MQYPDGKEFSQQELKVGPAFCCIIRGPRASGGSLQSVHIQVDHATVKVTATGCSHSPQGLRCIRLDVEAASDSCASE